MRVRVDWRAALALVGSVLKYLSAALVVPLAMAVIDGEDVVVFVVSILLSLAVGLALERLDGDPEIGSREGFLVVASTWLAVSIVGSVPYLLAAHGIPGVIEGYEGSTALRNPVNALFESTSGVTTTGATVIDIGNPEHSRALMLWRQLSQWLGGMGIVVLAVAILPELSVGGAQLMDAEAPGPGIEKLTPRIRETARALWLVYAGITALEMVVLYTLHLAGMAPEMTAYQAVAHGFSTMPTGGFSPQVRSIEAFSAAVQWAIVPFMFAAGVNFALFYGLVTGRLRRLVRDTEFRVYLGAALALAGLTALLLFTDPALAVVQTPSGVLRIQGDLEASLRHAVFNVVSMLNSTGYSSMDFNAWGPARQYLLVFAAVIGGSAGSTGGGVKVVRWIVVFKTARRELYTTVHPDAVRPVRLGDQVLDERTIRGIFGFTVLYLAIFVGGALFIAADSARVPAATLEVSVVEALTASLAMIGNIGPGLGLVGPMGGYTAFPATTKLLMVAMMWVGRLEILPVLVLLTRSYWRS